MTRARTAARPAGESLRDLVVCQGGPWHEQWFYADDWAHRVRVAGRIRERDADRWDPTGHAGRVFRYVRAEETRPHPFLGRNKETGLTRVRGTVLRWRPATPSE